MKLRNADIGLTIEIEDELIHNLYEYGLSHYPSEFGGLLMGYYSEDSKTVLIKDTVLPKKYTSSKYFFERGITGLKRTLKALFKRTPSLIYIGEWHTHPDNPPVPSVTDLIALREIVQHDKVSITNPILLIIGINKTSYELGFYVQFKSKIFKYEEERQS